MASNPRYAFKIVNQSQTVLATVLNARARTFNKVLNRPEEASFKLHLEDDLFVQIPDLIYGGGRYGLIIEREGTKVFGGEIVDVDIDIKSGRKEATFKARSWLGAFQDRVTTELVRYGVPAGVSSQDAGAIASDLIQRAQKGSALDLDGTSAYALGLNPGGNTNWGFSGRDNNKITVGGFFKLTQPSLSAGQSRTEVLAGLGGVVSGTSRSSWKLLRVASLDGSGNPSDYFAVQFADSTGADGSLISASTGAYYDGSPYNLMPDGSTWFVCFSWDGTSTPRRLIINAWKDNGDGTWTHVHSNGTYEDGIGSLSGSVPATPYPNPLGLHLGRDCNSLGAFFDGSMDDVFGISSYTDNAGMRAIRDGTTDLLKTADLFLYRFDSGKAATTYDSSMNTAPVDLTLTATGVNYVMGLRGYRPELDFGIRPGTIQTSVNRDRQYDEKVVYDAIKDLCEVQNGFDCEVTPDKLFNVYYPQKGTSRTDIVFRWGDKTNIDNVSFGVSMADIANEVIATSQGDGQTAAQTGEAGGSALATHAINVDSQIGLKLRQQTKSYQDISILSTLQNYAREYVRIHGSAARTYAFDTVPGLSPAFGSYNLGDSCRLIIDQGPVQEDTTFRIYGIGVTLTEGGVEKVTLGLSQN